MFRTTILIKVLIISLLVLLITGQARTAAAGTDAWTSNGPDGGSIFTLAIDPLITTTLYAGSQGGVFKSTNGGENWGAVNVGLTASTIFDLAIDPVAPSTIYAGTWDGGVFKSTDGGGNWSTINTGLYVSIIHDLAIDPMTSSTLYAGTNDAGIFKTTNGGESWSTVNTGLTALTVQVLAIDPVTPTTLYAGTYDGGIFKSTDGGGNWNAVNTGLAVANTYVHALAIDPVTTTTIYAGMSGGVFKSTNSGGNWSAINTDLASHTTVRALAIDPVTPTTIYAGTFGNGVFKSTNGGGNWNAVDTGLIKIHDNASIVYSIAIDPSMSTALYAGTWAGGIFKSNNGGEYWEAINAGLNASTVPTLVIDPATPTTLFAGTIGGGVFKSTNGSGTWNAVNTGLTSNWVNVLIIDPSTPTTLYAGTYDSGVFKSTNGGESWNPVNIGLTDTYVLTLTIDPVTPKILYAGTILGGIFKTTNGGEDWSVISEGVTGTDVRVLVVDPVTPTTIYAGTWGDGVFKSANGGENWIAINADLVSTYVQALVIDPAIPTALYAGTNHGGVFKSTDGGENWSAINTGLTDSDVQTLAIFPTTPATIYAGTRRDGIFKSTDGGENWSAVNTGLTAMNIQALVIDPSTPTILFAGTEGGGVAKSENSATTCGSGTWTSGNLEIHHINIGQGDSTLIVGPTGKSLLFDAGESYWNSSIDAQIIGPYIETVLGCKELDYVVISHFHVDHIGYVGYGGLYHLVETQGFTVGTTLVRDYNTYLGSTSGTFDNWKTYMEGAGQAKLHPVTAIEGTGQVDLGSGVTFDILTVDGNGAIYAGNFSADPSPPSENDYSVGAVLSYGDFDEWIGGDLDGQYETGGFGYTYHDIELSVAPEVGDVDVYKVNHHASSHSTSPTFIGQIDPEVSIVTVGDGNPYGHPTQAVMDRLLGTSTVYMTERGELTTNIGSAIVAGHIVIKTANGSTYTVNGTSYTATEPTRTDADGDGYFAEVDPADNNAGTIPAPYGGCDSTYQSCSSTCQATTGQVLINEVLPAPSSGPEWVELYNTTSKYVNIGYCQIDDIPAGSAAYQIPAGTSIPPHGFWTLDRTSYFNNAGDDVRFLNENATTILDSYTYGNTGYDRSWYRKPDGGPWASTTTTSPTKGYSNSVTTFSDVPSTFWAWDYIERLFSAGITGGCSTNPVNYCPNNQVTRAQMAVFLEKGIHGSSYSPPNVAPTFNDTVGTWAEDWIEALKSDGVTGGCGSGNYCPNNPVTRAQMAVFLLKSKYGSSYSPPAVGASTGFNDVPVTHWAAPWIKQLAAEGITGGCGGDNYCPNNSVTRAQMAVFLVKTFNLP